MKRYIVDDLGLDNTVEMKLIELQEKGLIKLSTDIDPLIKIHENVKKISDAIKLLKEV